MNSSDDIDDHISPFLTVESVLIEPIATLSSMLFLYGMYTVFFGLSVHVLSRRARVGSKFYLGWTTTLFVLATVYTVLYTWAPIRAAIIFFRAATTKSYTPALSFLSGDDGKTAHNAADMTVPILVQLLILCLQVFPCISAGGIVIIVANVKVHYSDSPLLYNLELEQICHVPLAFMAFVFNGITLGCSIVDALGVSDYTKYANLRLTAYEIENGNEVAYTIFHLILTFMIGGRILWISREARRLMGRTTRGRYNAIVAVIVESGVLYAATITAMLVIRYVSDPDAHGPVPIHLDAVATQVSGIAPTLVIVRVAYGNSVESVDQMVSALEFTCTQDDQQRSNTSAIMRQSVQG
ncbi:hypothetical protein E1B28_005489 [Marasmius oreades]|uniref:Uncharacterized protein n=1 Tax=Marasmius oreades TaxID=181124 RepID=A0A9P7UUM0_9AGAR|nr:uncharacterized protein E1B28_005489 [Marasmius oreades]KAG7094668.1 hypothetical protein E1B28_005489 [Marasmius oreades]